MPSISHVISYSSGMVINFTLQKIFVFNQVHRTRNVIIIVTLFFVLGLIWSSVFVHFITQINFFMNKQPITKSIVIGMLFFYNYFTRRIAFEGRI